MTLVDDCEVELEAQQYALFG